MLSENAALTGMQVVRPADASTTGHAQDHLFENSGRNHDCVVNRRFAIRRDSSFGLWLPLTNMRASLQFSRQAREDWFQRKRIFNVMQRNGASWSSAAVGFAAVLDPHADTDEPFQLSRFLPFVQRPAYTAFCRFSNSKKLCTRKSCRPIVMPR